MTGLATDMVSSFKERRGTPVPVAGEHKKIAATVIQLTKDDPKFVMEVIRKLQWSGEIEAGDLGYLERIAARWIRIADENLRNARR
jgi:hypothetical protein